MKQEKLLAELARAIESACAASGTAEIDPVEIVSAQLAKSFDCTPDEIAILRLDDRQRSLQFLSPKQLRTVGTIPLSSTHALAAKTARDRKAALANNFAQMRHATVFEGVPMGRNNNEMIQKIMSAPILCQGRVIGVVQVSRKGHKPTSAGPDFTMQQLRWLVAMSAPLGEFLLSLESTPVA